jgi:hypothetical protein
MSPFAFSDAFIVKPMDFPCFHRRRYFRSRLVTRYPPRTGSLLAVAQPHPPHLISPIGDAQVDPQDILLYCFKMIFVNRMQMIKIDLFYIYIT